MAEVAFAALVGLFVYVYLGYPAVIALLARVRRRRVLPGGRVPRPVSAMPLTVLIVAHNEVQRIAARLENLLALEYAQDRLEILVADDGSTDGTAELARTYEPRGVTVTAFAMRRGKPAVLNDVVPKARGEIVLLADARQQFDARALRALAAPFEDARVGAVSGELILSDGARRTSVGDGVGVYWRYEKFIRRNESLVDSTVGATGAIYAIRRDLFRPIPEETILDDVLIPLTIARQGYRVLFEPAALAYEPAPADAGEARGRKIRTIAGNFQLFARELWLLSPFRNRLWFQTVSHKGLRLLSPLLLAGAFGANLALLVRPVYRWTLAVQIAFYAAALAGRAIRNRRSVPRLLSVPYVFCLLNWITVVAFLRFVRQRQSVTWEKASR
jgi:cellulose synthase/poly-beta-1,6-N-acetylglucosamine synthase-like glycosyltransferase